MGYASLNGKSLGVLSALVKFGLLEGRGDDTRVSDLAVTIVAHPPGVPDRVAALSAAAGKPELFSELDSRFQNGKASDQAIRSYLLTQKFIPSAADTAIRAYRETKQLVSAESGEYDSAANSDLQEQGMSEAFEPPIISSVQRSAWASTRATGPTGPRGPFRVAVTTDSIEVSASLMNRADVKKLIRALQANLDWFPEAESPPVRSEFVGDYPGDDPEET